MRARTTTRARTTAAGAAGAGTGHAGAGRRAGVGAKIAAAVCGLVAVLLLPGALQLAAAEGLPTAGAGVAERQEAVQLVAAVAAVCVLLVLVAVVVRALGRLRQLTATVRRVAEQRLPDAFERVGRMPADGVPPVLEPFAVDSRDELAELAGALSALQDAGVALAVEQRRREHATARMVLDLGRRNQALLARVQAYVTELQEVADDPGTMAALFRIDRATARARRNGDSILVVAGAGPAPAREAAVPVADVVSAALAQVEDDVRVDLHELEDAALAGGLVPDLVHLLAELLENATRFSPPTSRVAVVGRSAREGYRLEVVDAGIGMSAVDLDAANARLVRAAPAGEQGRSLGLHVVARLAARHDLVVRLDRSAWGGLVAAVVVPSTLVTAAAPGAPVRARRVVDVTGHDARPVVADH